MNANNHPYESFEITFGDGSNLKDLWQPLHTLARRGQVALVERQLHAGAHPDDRDPSGTTALHWAAHNGHLAVARALVAHGADLEARDARMQASPLHWAILMRRSDMAELLLAAGCDANASNKWGESALLLAVYDGELDIVARLLRAGARADRPSPLGRALVDVALERGYRSIATLLRTPARA